MYMMCYIVPRGVEICAGHRLSLGVLLRRAADICSGLQEVHAMSIIVRDLKPVGHL